MPKGRFTEEQMVAIIREADREHVSVVAKRHGVPWQNGVTESFNGKFRDECLSLEWFRSRAERR